MSAYNQMQCPNCGGFKVTTAQGTPINDVEIKPQTTGKKILNAIFAVFITVWGVIFFRFGLLQNDISDAGTIAILILAGLLCLFLIHRFTQPDKKYHQLGINYSYECRLCGYNWSWDSRTPRPSVRVDPALIAKGEQKLREQEEWDRLVALDALRRRQLEDEQ